VPTSEAERRFARMLEKLTRQMRGAFYKALPLFVPMPTQADFAAACK
jgi:hypothetical protein